MADFYEVHGSQRGNAGESATIELNYQVSGTRSLVQVIMLIEAKIPRTFTGYVLDDYSWQEDQDSPGLWDISVTYAKPENKTLDRKRRLKIAFDTTGATTNVKHSKGTTAYSGPDGARKPDFGGAINVTADGIQGVDIVIPKLELRVTRLFDAGQITMELIKNWARNTGKTNSIPYMTFEPCELLFMGATGEIEPHNPEPTEVTFSISCSENVRNLKIGDLQVSKKGWEYVWIYTEEIEDAANGVLIHKPVAAYVEKLYDEFPFHVLGI